MGLFGKAMAFLGLATTLSQPVKTQQIKETPQRPQNIVPAPNYGWMIRQSHSLCHKERQHRKALRRIQKESRKTNRK